MWCLVVSNAAANLLYSKINLSMLEPIGFSPDICKTQNTRKQIRPSQLKSIRDWGDGGGGLSSASSSGCLDGPAVGRTDNTETKYLE